MQFIPCHSAGGPAAVEGAAVGGQLIGLVVEQVRLFPEQIPVGPVRGVGADEQEA